MISLVLLLLVPLAMTEKNWLPSSKDCEKLCMEGENYGGYSSSEDYGDVMCNGKYYLVTECVSKKAPQHFFRVLLHLHFRKINGTLLCSHFCDFGNQNRQNLVLNIVLKITLNARSGYIYPSQRQN